jgi:Flp pilus assembly protein TadB
MFEFFKEKGKEMAKECRAFIVCEDEKVKFFVAISTLAAVTFALIAITGRPMIVLAGSFSILAVAGMMYYSKIMQPKK